MRRGFDTEGVAAVGAAVSLISNVGSAFIQREAMPERGLPRSFRWVVATAAAAAVVDIVRTRRYGRRWIVLGTGLCAVSNLAAARTSDRGAANLAYHQAQAVTVTTAVTEGFSPFGIAVLSLTIGGTFLAAAAQHKTGTRSEPIFPPVLELAASAIGLGIGTDRLRRLDAEVNRLEARAKEHEAAAALEAEQTRRHRELHDTALQTLEAVSGDWHASDDLIRRLAAADAARLRRAIAGDDTVVSLAAGLTEIARLYRDLGLPVSLDLASLREPSSAAATVAMASATYEAMQNVVKHAGPCRVDIVAGCDGDSATVTIRDDGVGFDPSCVTAGFGLTESIRARLVEMSGTADIESEPGGGTTVRLGIPLT